MGCVTWSIRGWGAASWTSLTAAGLVCCGAIALDIDRRTGGRSHRAFEGPLLAWLAPEQGGLDWTTDPDSIEEFR
ncbi:hypothetical protein GCM10009753_65420 [Streptantibioticus ferralitis]